MTETAELELVEGELPSATGLFGSSDPATILTRHTETAGLLARVIRDRRLYARIGPKDHVLVEGWTLLGSLLGVFPVTVWTRPLEGGWEARVEARTLDGRIVGAAESMCLRSEKEWGPNPTRGKPRDEYALRSMAATRATSKALRQPLGFVMQLAGFDPTPAEEIPRGSGETRAAQAAGAAEPEEGEWWEPDHDPADAELPAAPAVARPLATAGQLRKLNATYRDHRLTDRQSKLEFAREITGREITSSKELTGAEVSMLLTALDSREARTVAILEQLADPVEPGPEPEPLELEHGPAAAQRAHIYQLLEQRHLTGTQRLDLLSELVNRPIHAVDHLTPDEAGFVIQMLQGEGQTVMPER
jgi:hypothetical protein